MPNRAFNLLANDAVRATLADEPEPCGPQVPLVIDAFALAGCRERLTRAGAGPDTSLLRPLGELQGVLPAPDAAEEVTSLKFQNVICTYIANVSFIDGCIRPEIAKPLRGETIVFVEVHQWLVTRP